MSIEAFKKFLILIFFTSFTLVVIIGLGLFFGVICSYLAASKNIIYHVEDENLAVDLISETLNKAGYSNKEEKSGELVFTPQPRIEKYYGKVHIKIYDKEVEVTAPKILFTKYLNRVKVQ